ncbi:AAA family ATPase [Microlunatus parietis]|uniref:Thymidylate kinase n=1 Tax=Microlunatus parietis TaxID=682979 RepID=A0A7Y9I7N7_9ACTN|nr:AAA family ATPase [Microlunatus parietis]NYE71831.1 thymidylate kinase [Microlunatus parietis]
MTLYQIDGLSGTGKSTLASELRRRGHRAVDADAEFGYYGDPATGRPSKIMIRDHWIWDLDRLRTFAAEVADGHVFLCGGALNQEQVLDLFARRFVLHIDNDTLRHRLRTRTNNDNGKAPAELAEQLRLNEQALVDAERQGTAVIDATRPIADVATEILARVRRRA